MGLIMPFSNSEDANIPSLQRQFALCWQLSSQHQAATTY